MNEVKSFESWQELLTQQEAMLLFVKTDHCSVCDGLYPQVERLADGYPFPFFYVNVAQVPEMAGQLSLFTAPVVLLFRQGKELTRFARFVPMEQLRKRLDELKEACE
ncbi:thioredoxin family protein [Sporosarcina gallistercoris]|uniref:Thioredoxin family protein n=1 Tax=Sporosarcina gallistercoris TaxID=2762245 RepID=A0ABR8PMN4_9BACL|nr:thioredoxin family protein [Sporosarcina gallistercoris]MBD7909440.1 thioredoxin family protein [Sporosarcina gallistercoris]